MSKIANLAHREHVLRDLAGQDEERSPLDRQNVGFHRQRIASVPRQDNSDLRITCK